jgi:HlyD family secretion protein
MKIKYKKTTITIIILLIIIAGVWVGSRPKPVHVVLKTVETGRVESTVTNTRAGTVQACRRARMAPASGGQIAKLPVHEGDQVKEGQILLEMWNEDLTAQLQHAQRQAQATRARADEACVTADVAEHEAQRLTKLHKQKLTSEENMDRAVGEASAKRAGCRAAKATIDVSEAQIDIANALLERTLLRAPFDGTIAEVNGELGEFVTPSPVGVSTLPAIDLIDNSCLYISAPIDEVDAPAIRTEMNARISLDAIPGKKFEASVRRIAPYVLDREKQARTVDVEAVFSNIDDTNRLLPGYSADVEIILAIKENTLRIPTEALQENNLVLVYDESEGIIQEREITTGVANWVYTEVLSGLTTGERVVTSVDREGVSNGARVVPETETESGIN